MNEYASMEYECQPGIPPSTDCTITRYQIFANHMLQNQPETSMLKEKKEKKPGKDKKEKEKQET